ncbi:MAG: hypothetical protein PHP54_01660 [Clostridia bacterium]|nr:hypothetical protein [Clostridia bacterium]
MYEKIAWENFLKTGDIESYLEYRKFMSLNGDLNVEKNEGDFLNEFNESKGNSDKRNSL